MKKFFITLLLFTSTSVFAGQGAYVEFLRLLPGVQSFEDDSGNIKMTEQYLREVVDDMHDAGIDTIVITYVEYFGFWFYEHQGEYQLDRDTMTQGQFWHDKMSTLNQAIVERFDPLEVLLSQASLNGQKVYVGLGRNGDTSLIGDIHTVNTGGADPFRYGGETINARLSRAISQTKNVALEIDQNYGHYSALEGWYLSHEISHLSTGNNYVRGVTVLGGNALRNLGKPIMMAPADTQDIGDYTAGNNILISGVDIIAPQDAVGSGYDFFNNVNTFSESVPLSQINGIFGQWDSAIQVANNWLADNGGARQIDLWSTTELWKMDGPAYGNAYPAKIRRIVKQLENTPSPVTKNIFYAWLGMVDSGDNSLRPSQVYNGISNTADRSEGLFSFIKNDAL